MSKFEVGERVFVISTNEQVEILEFISEDREASAVCVRSLDGETYFCWVHDLVKIKRTTLGKVESYNKQSSTKLNEQDVLSLIDVALDTGDREWFDELVVMLNDARAVSVV